MSFNEEILELLQKAKIKIKTAVNISMVYTYYEIGKRIVEEEQNGNDRAEYGKHLISELSDYLTKNLGKGFSVGNLKNIRQFYRVCSGQAFL